MKKRCCGIFCIVMLLMMIVGCGRTTEEDKDRQETNTQETEQKLEEELLSADADEEALVITEEYGEEMPYPELAEFLINYYQIPEEYQSETRYYYNYIDVNEDGVSEIFAFVIGDYTEVSFGDPALILTVEGESFGVIESFEGIHTPVTIADSLTNGWHDIIYYEYGRGAEDGYRICRYNPEGGYQTELSEVVDELEPMGGTQILSNNLIDDMDQGRYLTLAPVEEE